MRFVFGHHHRPNPDIAIDPFFEWEIQEILDRSKENNKTVICLPNQGFLWGPPIEVGRVETLHMQNSEFQFTEALWQIATPKVISYIVCTTGYKTVNTTYPF